MDSIHPPQGDVAVEWAGVGSCGAGVGGFGSSGSPGKQAETKRPDAEKQPAVTTGDNDYSRGNGKRARFAAAAYVSFPLNSAQKLCCLE